MDKKIIIKYIVIIAVILIVIFLSQQAYSRSIGKTFIYAAANQAASYLAKGTSWAASNIMPKINGEVQSRGVILQNAANQETKKVSENIGTQIGNYFSGIANSIAGKSNNNCAATPTN